MRRVKDMPLKEKVAVAAKDENINIFAHSPYRKFPLNPKLFNYLPSTPVLFF